MTFIWLIIFLFSAGTSYALQAFPTAEGFGTDTTHGRGGTICRVTNTSDSGAGSLRNCLEASGTRIVVFTTGGTISLLSNINMTSSHDNVYVAGQTAPGGGIQVKNHSIVIAPGSENIVFRHMRFRQGVDRVAFFDPESDFGDNITMGSGSGALNNIVIDHCSLYWGTDENIGLTGVQNYTIQWSIIAEGGPYPTYDSGGLLSIDLGIASGDTQNVSIHHNLFADNMGRNPVVGLRRSAPNPVALVDIRNNVVYHWDEFAIQVVGEDGVTSSNRPRSNIINNFFKPGDPNSGPENTVLPHDEGILYLDGNWGPNCPSGCGADEWDITVSWAHPDADTEGMNHVNSATEFSVAPVTTTPTSQLFALVMANVGAIKPSRDAVDLRIVEETEDDTSVRGPGADGETWDYPTLAAGTAYTDTDSDGMSDTWETTCSGTLGTMNPNSATDGADIITGVDASVDGYSKVEVFLNAMAGDYGTDGLTTCAQLLEEDATPPSTPTMNTASVVSDAQIDLSWSAATDEQSGISGYELQWCTDDGSETCTPSTTISLGNVTSYSHTVLTPETTYGYRVRALNGASTPVAGSYSSPVEYATTEADESDITTGLVSHWTFDNVLTDSGSAGANGTGVGSPTYGIGQVNDAIDLNGTTQYVTAGDNAAHDFGTSTAFAISLWAKHDASTDQVYISKIFYDTGAAEGGWGVKYGQSSNTLRLFATSNSFNAFCTITTDGTGLTDGNWHHIAVNIFRDATCATNDVVFYIDGVLKTSTVSASSNNMNVNLSNDDTLFIGAENEGGAAITKLDGRIDDVRIYNRTLAADDVLALAEMTGSIIADHPSPPTSLSDSASGTATFAGAPTSLSDSASGTATFAGAPTSLSDSASSTATFAGAPTGVSSP